MNQQQRRVLYAGTVQGVGFRYATVRLARGFDVTGFVRNLPDGRVELVVEGVPSELDAFLNALSNELGGYIRDAAGASLPATAGFEGFGVRY